MATRIIIASIVGGIFSFLLGWVVFGMLMMDYYSQNMVEYTGLMRMEGDFRLYGVFIAQVLSAGVLAYAFDRIGSVRTMQQGAIHGFILGGLMTASFDFYQWSNMNLFPWKVYVVDVAVNTVFTGAVGAVVALVVGWKRA